MSAYEQALPILQRYGCKAIFFIATSFITERRVFWWDRIAYLLRHSTRSEIVLHRPFPIHVDLKNDRLFATPEGYKAVLVFELKSGKPIHTITGIGKPHAVLYREDLNRIYITDGDAGDLKIFDGTSYALLSSVKLLEDAGCTVAVPRAH